MKSLILLSLFSYNALASTPKIVYGTDDRKEVENQSSSIQKLASGVATNTVNSVFSELSNYIKFEHQDLMKYRICFDEPFAKQSLLGDCTGFLVDKDVLLTAGHCVETLKECQDRSWVFDYTLSESEKGKLEKENVFKCKRVLAKVEDQKTRVDYALVQLDRKTQNRHIFKVSNNSHIKKSTVVGMLGHPVGLPMKFAGPERVHNTTYNTYFTAKLDAFGGNSGSPVFRMDNQEVIGILTGGAMDFDDTVHQCKKSVVCAEGTQSGICQKGERILKSSIVKLPTFLNKRKRHGESPLLKAVQKRSALWLQKNKKLLAKKSLINKDYFGWTPLHQAVLNKDFKMVKLLVSKGADLNLANNYDSHTPVLIALITKQYDVAEYLVDQGANLDAQEKSTGETILMKAINDEQIELSKKIAKRGANLNLRSKDGHNVFDFADFIGNYELMKILEKLNTKK